MSGWGHPSKHYMKDQAVIGALSGKKAALTYSEIAQDAGLTIGEVRAALRRLRRETEGDGVTTSQNMRTKVTHHFLADRSAEAMWQLFGVGVPIPQAGGER